QSLKLIKYLNVEPERQDQKISIKQQIHIPDLDQMFFESFPLFILKLLSSNITSMSKIQEKEITTLEMEEGNYSIKSYELGSGSPICVITAGMHGDEKPAIRTAERLIGELENKELNGKVKIIPRSNILACLRSVRKTPWPEFEKNESENRDLNRCFDAALEKVKGNRHSLNITEQIAYHILEEVKEADYYIDMHTATWTASKELHIRYKRVKSYSKDIQEEMHNMAAHTGLEKILSVKRPQPVKGILSEIAPVLEVPSILIEIGGAKNISKEDEKLYLETMHNILKYLEILPGKVEKKNPKIYNSLESIYASKPGMVELKKDKGEKVQKDDLIAEIKNKKCQTVEKIYSPVKGIVESVYCGTSANQNTRIANIAYNS
ncbi:MAG: succinylglutamate desuccinylase/aspartoacylase family protein, partial [Candidatus Nanohaloarchaea archaeon]|nr:succinylglutamate desuccinylase/aspartoacylase family protein [Candidatus Nanohaloarchaea archaeon]